MDKLTPLIRLDRLSLSNNIYAKIESFNVTGSIKDRAVYQMLLEYQKDGILTKDSTVLVPTSGNTGISLAYYSKVFGYQALIVMPNTMSKERRDMISSYGGELLLVSGGMKECEEKCAQLVKENKNYFIFDQFNNENNSLSHYLTTAKEIDTQLKDIDYIFIGIGTGGTISGIGRYFKEHHPNTKIIGIEPYESPMITKGYASGHLIQGIGANFISKILDFKVIDEVITVKGKESIDLTKELQSKDNLYVGISSGAALLGCLEYIKTNNLMNKNLVVIFPDKGDRYSL